LIIFIIIDDSMEYFEYKPVVKKGLVVNLVTNSETADVLKYSIVLDKVYLGIIEPFIRDQYIEDVSCDGVGPIFVEHKIFGSCENKHLIPGPRGAGLLHFQAR
jgi:Flp pilus assembly CpaF family ATPase